MRMLGANRALAKRGKSTIRDKHTHWLHRFVRLIFSGLFSPLTRFERIRYFA
jgi:hypothetical protein